MTDATQKGRERKLFDRWTTLLAATNKGLLYFLPDSIGDPRGTVKPTSQLWMGDGLNECGEQKRSAIQSTVDNAWVTCSSTGYSATIFI